MVRSCMWLVIAVGACSFQHGVLPIDGGGTDGAAVVFAVHPPLAGPGEVVAIEGILGDGSIVVRFPSGATASVGGTRHVLATVPADAGTGAISVESSLGTGTGSFRGTTFATSSGVFLDDEVQSDFARIGARLPAALSGSGAVAIGRHLFVIGGELADGTPSAVVSRARIFADGTLSAFELAGTLATPRAGPAIVAAGSRVIVVGGRSASGALDTTESTVVAADGTLGAFSPGPTLPAPRAYAAAQVVGDSLVVAGGETSDGAPHAEVYRAPLAADGAAQAFVDAGTLQVARSRFGLVVSRSRLVAVGGRGRAGGGISDVETAPIDRDGALRSFAAAPALVTARGDVASYVLGRELCVVGGSLGTAVECAAIDADGTPVAFANRPPLPSPRIGAAAVVVPDRVWLVGGGTDTRLAFATLDRDAIPAPFAAGAALASPGRDVTCAIVGDFVYVFGGVDAGGSASTTIQRASIDERGALGAFATLPITQLIGRRAHQAVVLDNTVALIGGANAGGDLDSIELLTFDAAGALSAPTTGPALTVVRRGSRCAVVDQTLYVIGGRGTTNPGRTWEASALTASGLAAFAAGTTQIANARGFYTSAVTRANVYVFGTGSIAAVEATQANAGALASFAAVDQLAAVRENHMAVFAGDRVWAFGGFDAQGTVTTVEAAPITAAGLDPFAVQTSVGLPAAIATGGCALRIRDYVHLVGGSVNSVLAPAAYSAVLRTP